MAQAPDTIAPLRFGEPLGPSEMAWLRRQMAIEGFKWDPRVGDQETLCDRALYVSRSTWLELADLAERLDREMLVAESEIATRPDLIRELALPRAITKQLIRHGPRARGPRVSRYDFHWTSDGWKVSEVNSDVPGGYIEASEFSRRFAALAESGARPPGDPTAILVEAIRRHGEGSEPVALVHATAYSDDAQVMHYLAKVFRASGTDAQLVGPEVVFARSRTGHALPRPSHIMRFFPAEWLPMLGHRSGWRSYFEDASIPQTNPAGAILSQSKRWGLLWDDLTAALPTWKLVCPDHKDVGSVLRPLTQEYVYKPTLGRVGAGIVMPGQGPVESERRTDTGDHEKSLRQLQRDRCLRLVGRRSRWVSQQRFRLDDAEASAEGASQVCLGVFVIDGSACGVYGRRATGPWVDMYAQDLAVLVEADRQDRPLSVDTEPPAAEVVRA